MTEENKDVRIEREILDLFDQLKSYKRAVLVSEIYTADLTGETVLDKGHKTLKFWELEVGDIFVCVPGPEDDCGNGGLRHTVDVYRKIKTCVSRNCLDFKEMFDSARVTDEESFTIHPASWILRLNLKKDTKFR